MTFACIFRRGLAAVALVTVFSAAQQAPTFARDPQAVALLQATITAMGGLSAAQNISTVTARGNTDTALPSFVFEDDFSGGGHEFRRQLTDGTNTRLVVSGHGNPASAFNNKTVKLRQHVAYAMLPLHTPVIILLNILQNTNYNLALAPQVVIGTHTCFQLLANDASTPVAAALSVQRWYIDATTGLPVRIQHRVADATYVESYDIANVDYSTFQSVNGVLIPFSLVTSQNGKQTGTVTLTSVVLNLPISSSEFDIPGVQ